MNSVERLKRFSGEVLARSTGYRSYQEMRRVGMPVESARLMAILSALLPASSEYFRLMSRSYESPVNGSLPSPSSEMDFRGCVHLFRDMAVFSTDITVNAALMTWISNSKSLEEAVPPVIFRVLYNPLAVVGSESITRLKKHLAKKRSVK